MMVMTWHAFSWYTSLDKGTEWDAAVVIGITGSTIGFTKFYLEKSALDDEKE